MFVSEKVLQQNILAEPTSWWSKTMILWQLIQIILFVSSIRSQNGSQPTEESHVVELTDDNPFRLIQSPGFPTKPYPKNFSANYELKVS